VSDDQELVRAEYATEHGLHHRARVYEGMAGPDAKERAFEVVRDRQPGRVLEIGCGFGEFAARLQDELGVEVVAVDLSPRMVELTRERGVWATVADVQELPFADGEFDCVVANWMLYHVPDLDRGLAEIARVLTPGGRLVADTNGHQHLTELWSLVGRDRANEPPRFFSETGERFLLRHFARVERHDVNGTVIFRDSDAVRGYIASSVVHKELADRVPEFDLPLVATRVNTIFVAEKAP
jgi:SAM-dependent methyltransferase